MENSTANQLPTDVQFEKQLGQLATFIRVMRQAGLPIEESIQVPINDPSFRRLLVEFWRGRGAVVAPPVSVVTASVIRSVDEQFADWVNFYRDVFREEVDFSGLRVPEHRDGFDRLIVIAKKMSPERVFQKCRGNFRCWKYTYQSLDKIVFDVDSLERKYRRSDHESYAIWVRDREEADQELKSRSANDLAHARIPGITLEARELYELKYFKETRKHLDRHNWTLCAGSRGVRGRVPSVSWDGDDDRLRVEWDRPDVAGDRLRSREAVL